MMSFLEGYARRLGVLEYLGTWNASTNSPALSSGVGQRGGYYVVAVSGATNLDGVIDWKAGDWAIFNGTAWEKIDNTDQVSSVAGKTGAVTLQASDVSDFNSAVDAVPLSAFAATKEPTGHKDRTQSTVNFNETTRTFTISPVATSFEVWIAGVKYTISSTLNVQIPNTTGNYFFYIDSNSQLQYQASFDLSLFEGKVYTGFVHWNSTDGKAIVWGEERHGIVMDGATHSYLHTTRGTQLVSGGAVTYTVGNGNANADAQIGVADLRIRDEDILVNVAHAATPTNSFEQVLFPTAKLPILYRDGSAWRKTTATDYPLITGTSRAKYNEFTGSTWQLTEANADNKVLITYVFATTDFREPVFGILGQSQYADLDTAKAQGGWDQITFGDLPAQELKLLYIVYYKTASTMTNAAKSAIVDISDARFTFDRQVSASSFNGDHSNLSGLTNDDHLQYHNDTRGDARYYTKTQADALLAAKEPTISAGTTAQYWRGDKSFQTLNAAAVANTPAGGIASTTVQAALNELDTEKQPTGNYITALTGDVTASGPGSAAATLANSGVVAGTYSLVTVDAKGRVTVGSNTGSITRYSYFNSNVATNATVTYSSVAQLTTVSLPVGLYRFFFAGNMQSTQTTAGVGVRIAPVTATVTTVSGKFNISQGVDGVSHDFEYDQTLTTTNVTSASVAAANTNFAVNGMGVIRVTVAGTVAIQIRTETAGQTATLQPDAVLILELV